MPQHSATQAVRTSTAMVLPDVVCHFRTQLTGFQSGDTLGILKGKTFQGSPIIGQEAIVTVP